MEQNQGVDEILRCLRVSFLQLHNLFLSQPHKDERLWESCQHKFIFVAKYMVDMTTDVKLPSILTYLQLFLHSRVALVKVSESRTPFFIRK